MTPSENPNHNKRKFIVIALAVVILIAAPLAIAEFTYQQRVNHLQQETTMVGETFVKQVGGTEAASEVKAPYVWNLCTDEGPCPNASAVWLVLGDAKNNADLQDKILRGLAEQGYSTSTNGSLFGGQKDKTVLEMKFYPVGSRKPPYPAPSGKEWSVLNINAYESTR